VSPAALARLLARAATARPRLVLVACGALALGAAALALQLHASAATSTFVSSSSSQYQATQRYYRSFGEEPIAVLVRGSLEKLVLSSDIVRLAGLEGCLSGNVPAAALPSIGGASGPCGQLQRAHTVKVVIGPGTFVNEAAMRINEQLAAETKQAQTQAKQAEAVVYRAALARGLGSATARSFARQASKITIARFQEGLVTLALRYGITSRPSIENGSFVSALVFDNTKPVGTPKQRFAYLFPGRDAALIAVRMRAGLSEAQRRHTIALVRAAVAMPQWHLGNGETYLVTGVPVIVSDLVGSIGHAIELLMIAVVLVMAAALGLIFTGRPRLLPLVLALLATALTFGALALAGASLTMASIAVLPVLVGLAVDYAIQFQSRVGEEQDDERADAPARVAAVLAAAGSGGATILTAGAASAAAMLALLLSPVPMVQGFGVLLVIGVALALALTLTAGAAALSLGRPPRARPPRGPAALAGAGEGLAAAWRGAGEMLRSNPLTSFVTGTALGVAVRRPERVLAAGLALAALGWGLDTQTSVQTDITKLVPQSMSSLRGLDALERTTGVAGEIDLLVRSRDVAAPATIEWMSAFESRVLARFGYSQARGCTRSRLCPAFSLPDLFQLGEAAGTGVASGGGSSGRGGSGAPRKLTAAEVDGVLSAIPSYFSQDVVTADRRTATLAFGIRAMSLQEQQRLIEAMRSQLRPPAGVSASLVGLPVLAAQSGTEVASPWRRLVTLLVGLALVAAVLLTAFRGDRRRALTPLVPIVLATGWSALVLFAVRVPLNPMSVTLGALVIAISTEFSVLLSERFRQELAGAAERDTVAALRRSYARTGAAVGASGVTAIAGFGVLALSNIAMLRDFGVVTLIDLTVSLLGVLIALPAVLAISERAERSQRDAPLRARGVRALLGLARRDGAGTRAARRRRVRIPWPRRGHEPA
jgi:predicted RND superfamily exporter protein